jgi:adenylate cyclase
VPRVILRYHGASMERRLAAILAADVVGYSRLMEVDETGTLARLKTHRLEQIDPVIAKHRGNIIKTTGDGLLVEFASVTDAVVCAAEIQERMAWRNADVSAASAIQLRIGVNLGDVIFEDGDIFGDGVNVAARLEALAEPGGICISAAVREQLGERLALGYEDLGEQMVKNISRPICTFRVLPARENTGAPQRSALTAMPAVPSIAVLPFNNMSGDPEQEFFADGLTEDIITELSRFRELLVISRNSVFVHKNKPVKVRDVAREFGVDYVVEGSVRKAVGRVRITVQLIDAKSDTHVWAERYDRSLEDIFAIQDEITCSIVATLRGRVEAALQQRAKRKPTESMAAYECVLSGKVLHHRSDLQSNKKALAMIDRALGLDPDYAHAHAWKACVIVQAWANGWRGDYEQAVREMNQELEIAQALDDNDADVHRMRAAVGIAFNNFNAALYHQERALSLNPNCDITVVQQGELLTWIGRPHDGIEWIKKAMRLNPHHPERFWSHLGRAHYTARAYADALGCFSKLTAPDCLHHAFMAAAAAQLGDAAAAAVHAREVLRMHPEFTRDVFIGSLHYQHDADREHLRDGLKQAGLPG